MTTDEAALLVPLCKSLALWLHRDQTDKQGAPYSEHLARVAAAVADDPLAECAAWLHDSIEDGKVTHKTLNALGIPPAVVGAVGYLTRRLWENGREGYSEYIARIAELGSSIARRVKLADLTDNLDPSRGPIPDSLKARYEAARERLMGAEER